MVLPKKRNDVGRGNNKFGGKSDTITIRVPSDEKLKQEIKIKIARLLKPYLK